MLREAPDNAIAAIAKNGKESVHVALSSFKGRSLIDVRTYAVWGDDPAPRPTRNGVSLSIDKLDDLMAALASAKAEAVRLGLLSASGAAERQDGEGA